MALMTMRRRFHQIENEVEKQFPIKIEVRLRLTALAYYIYHTHTVASAAPRRTPHCAGA